MNKNRTSSPRRSDDDKPRHEKISAIKQALEAGTYVVDNRALADSLLSYLLGEQWEKLHLSKP